MRMTDVDMSEDIHILAVENLRKLGIKHRTKKTHNKKLQNLRLREQHIFKKPLQLLPLHTVKLDNGSDLEVPELVHQLCSYINSSLETEGLFRKAGSTARQKEIKLLLEAECELSNEHHVIDVANVLKLFFRELPEPLIPYIYHDTFLQSLIVKKEQIVEALLLTCLLLPSLHLNTLFYFMKFLQRVVAYCKYNKMDIKNIAIVMTPTIMPIEDKVITYNTQRLNHHVRVVQLLLENAEEIGVVPTSIVQSLHFSQLKRHDKEVVKKKKKRSGSLTRMFNGLKKIVSSKSADDNPKELDSVTPDLLLTPCLTRSAAKKRKVMQSVGFSGKRRRQILESLPQNSALMSTPFKTGMTPVCHHPHTENIQTPIVYPPELKIAPTTETEFVRIPKTEYEEIKNRVSAIENRISQELNSVQATSSSHVQTVYEKTLEEVESLSNSTTEQLAKRLSRELKIRRSAEQKVIRSPSARKIGSIRRRSQEGAAKVTRNQSCNIPKVTLKRGRPNTVLSGLPQPSPYKADITRASSFHTHSTITEPSLEKWASAELYFKEKKATPTIINAVYHRDSLAKLRTQNAGMVSAKAKLFNDLSDNSENNKHPEYKFDRKNIRKGGSFPRQNPICRRQKVFDHKADKENDPFQYEGKWENGTKQLKKAVCSKSPRRVNSVRVLH